MGLLEGKKVLITGARKGIGRGIAITLANEGADVGINDILDDEFTTKLLGVISGKGVDASFHQGDMSSIEGISSVFDSFMEQHHQIVGGFFDSKRCHCIPLWHPPLLLLFHHNLFQSPERACTTFG